MWLTAILQGPGWGSRGGEPSAQGGEADTLLPRATREEPFLCVAASSGVLAVRGKSRGLVQGKSSEG